MKTVNSLTETEKEAAEALNSFFQSVFVKEEEYQEEEIDEADVGELLEDIEITEEDVLKKLERLNPEKAQGPDGVNPKVLKECSKHFVKPLHLLFQKSLFEKTLPKDWKLANVIPLHKSGNTTEAGNYRPVSLTSVPCKLMESIVMDGVKKHLKKRNIPNDCQHGFVSGRSCLTNLLLSVEDWTEKIDNGSSVDIIYLDISKAFDSVPHKRLTEKIKRCGLNGNVLGWLIDFLKDRKMKVCVRGEYSGWCDVYCSVPQGSVGGPTQFSIFIDDMADYVNNKMIQFADDTKLWNKIDTEEERESIQSDLQSYNI